MRSAWPNAADGSTATTPTCANQSAGRAASDTPTPADLPSVVARAVVLAGVDVDGG
jgi:hypothetical protein